MGHSISPGYPNPPADLGVLGQGTFFVPLQNARMVIGGALAASGSRLQSINDDRVSELPESLFQGETSGIRRSSSITETSTKTVSLLAAREFGRTGRTTVGAGVDYVSGKGLVRGQISLDDGIAAKVIERLEAVSNIDRTRFQFGLTHEFSGGHKLGLLYRRGLATADDSDRSRQTSGLHTSLDSVRYRGRSSEFGLRLRGPITRRLFYGVEGSWLVVGLNERIRRAVIVDSTERESISRTAVSLGLGYALRRRTILSADLGFGQSHVSELHYEDATANLIQDERQKIPFISTQLGVQTDVWRELFASASIFTIRQSCATDLKLYPDRFGRRLTSYGTFEPDGITRKAITNLLSDLGVGWRFTPNLLTQYVASFNFDLGPPRHIILLRYSFQRER